MTTKKKSMSGLGAFAGPAIAGAALLVIWLVSRNKNNNVR